MYGRRNIYLAILFAVCFLSHLLVLRFYQLGTAMAQTEEPEEKYIEVAPVTPEEMKKLSARQVIELPPGPDSPQPRDAKYLSERAMMVEKETMAPPGRPFAGHSSPPVPSRTLFREKDSQEQGEISFGEKLKPDFVASSDLFNDRPGSVDFLEGALSGEVTLANAFKYQYAYFFNQLKRSIQFYWNPQPALRIIPTPNSDLITNVRFVLNQNGFLQDLEVISSSGFQAIDRAAISAIKNSTPVFSVPQELLDENKQLVINCQFRIMRR